MKTIIWSALLFLAPLYFFSDSAAAVQQTTHYLSQDVIDTTILKGFYVLTEAASCAGVGFKQKEAIETAKRFAKTLRDKAQGDPNEKYILWKVSELEAQINLEEKDLLFQQMQEGQITINSYVAKYNAEVGKSRPDFATLKKIHVQLGTLDVKKANELADSYNQRYRAMSREVPFSIEKSISAGDVNNARNELGYLLRNKNFLSISDAQYIQIQSRVEELIRAFDEKPLIESETDSAIISTKNFDFNKARTFLFSAKYRVQNTGKHLPDNLLSRLKYNIDKADKLLVQKEDSLVTMNLSIFKKQGVNAADDFLQKVLRPCGVDRNKTAYVDSIILKSSSPQNNTMSTEIEIASSNSDDKNRVFDDIRENAHKKAQAKRDSIQIENEEMLSKALPDQTHDDNLSSMQTASQNPDEQKNQVRANSVTQNIYSLIEQNHFQNAVNLFSKEKSFLKRFLIQDAYQILEMTINQMEPSPDQQVTYITPTTPQSTPNSNNDADLMLKKNQDRAQQESIAIYAMLEKSEISAAYNKFMTIRRPLSQFLDKEAFDLLESTVTQAYNFAFNQKAK